MTEHASEEVLTRFVEDALGADERARLEDHLDSCDDCRATVAMLVRAAVAEKRASEPTIGTHPPDAFLPTEVSTSLPRRPHSRMQKGEKLGRYVIEDTLGMGGMGVVYAAHDPDLHRDIAIKVLQPELSRTDPEATRRIVREAQAMAKLAHPNVVSVFDVGAVEGQVFIAMERVAGKSLREWLAAARRSPAEILEVFIGAGRGLVAAHNAGMVHRDFKPDNVLVDTDGRARVTDFGLAFDQSDQQAIDISGEGATKPIVGTPAYMAPEQHAGTNVDPRTDQFSFAVALYEALHGKRPFAGKSREELAGAILDGKIDLVPGARVPASLTAIIRRALSVKPGDRYSSMEELLRALGRDRGRRPRQLALVALVLFVITGVAFMADFILRERTQAVTRSTFASARSQLDKLLALRTDAFVAQADSMYRLPIMLEIGTARDQHDFGLGDASEDIQRIAREHETLKSADWVGLVGAHRGDVFAIADQKGRLLYDSANPEVFGNKVTGVSAIAAAYSAQNETYLGVVDGADPAVVSSGLLGGAPQPRLYVAFMRAKRIGAVPNAMFMQLVQAGRLLDEVGVGQDTLLSVVTAEGVAEGRVPKPVLLAVGDGGIDELALDDGNWLAERTPLRSRGQDTAIAQLVLARHTNLGLSGLFPHAQQLLGGMAAVFAAFALAGFVIARRRDLNRRGA